MTFIERPRWQLIIEASLFFVLLFFFALMEWLRWRADLSPAALLSFLQKCVVMCLLLVRRPASRIDRSLLAWGSVFIATFAMLFSDTPPRSSILAEILQCIGALLMVVSLLSLGANFGMLPALRGITTTGPYRLVRHPYYAGASLLYLGDLLLRLSWMTLAAFLFAMLALLLRLQREEALLVQEEEYLRYCERVRYRLLYGVY